MDTKDYLKLMTPSAKHIPILSSEDNKVYNIKIIDPTQPIEYIGAITSPSASTLASYQRLLKKASTFKYQLENTPVQPHEVILAYKTIFLPSISYPISVYSLSPVQYEKVHKQYTSLLLAKSGFNCNFPRALIYGDHTYGGLGFKHLFETTLKLDGLQFLWLHPETKLLATQYLFNYNFLAGSDYDTLKHPIQYSYIEYEWWDTLLQGMQQYDISIHLLDPQMLHLQQTNDQFIMKL
eukprot:CAMPEP_0184870146 /NCGR_PEP_ID=MMETSP0580-20130426/36635_1 /TAXON_ID=1118495 /ORGANISM="Dactyliosolen fragilissimus" /LENGTH=236 /DNA_ID=CAMNT_0027372093 /DNA_START=584 /DNA_END=1291 /DNA_ORIENTATION=+